MRFVTFLLVMLMAVPAFADATAEIVSLDKDSNGNIRVWTQYKVDGVEVNSKYAKIDGKQVWCTRYNKQQLLGKTKPEILEHINKDLEAYCKTLIRKKFNKNAPKTLGEMAIEYNAQANQDFIDSNFPVVVGEKITKLEAVFLVDSDGDGVNDKEITIRTDGTKSISDITP